MLVGGEELSPSEAAAVLGLAPEAVRKRLQRARERLALEMREVPDLLREKVG
jgi:DNA-directed RNA polymerase specialized sigma24 family protein